MSNLTDNSDKRAAVLYIPHGGGPLPLLDDQGHQVLINFLKNITPTLGSPSAIVVISAHWEQDIVTVTSNESPSIIYDYYGFPDESYEFSYPAYGNPSLATNIVHLLQKKGIKARQDEQRGFDHGLFVPLKIMYPKAHIPCIQLSLMNNLDAESHIKIGRALSSLRKQNILVIGSGFSFHNLSALLRHNSDQPDDRNERFQQWLIETCVSTHLSAVAREQRLLDWAGAPFARYCHPREEHLLPLHICYGLAGSPARLVFDDEVMGKRACAFLW